jgi:hypothetical protein
MTCILVSIPISYFLAQCWHLEFRTIALANLNGLIIISISIVNWDLYFAELKQVKLWSWPCACGLVFVLACYFLGVGFLGYYSGNMLLLQSYLFLISITIYNLVLTKHQIAS